MSRPSAWYGPGVVTAAVSTLMVLLTTAWLVFAALGPSTRWMVMTVVGLLVVDSAVLVIVRSIWTDPA